MVELKGFEPLTPCVQGKCSSQLSYSPIYIVINTLKCQFLNKFTVFNQHFHVIKY